VKSVGNDTKLEGEVLSHAVEVTSSVDDETYTFSIADDTATVGEDFNATPSFTAGVTYDANSGNITVPAGVTAFDVFVALNEAVPADQTIGVVQVIAVLLPPCEVKN